MSNRMQEILGGILGMFGNNQDPRVIDKSVYPSRTQEFLVPNDRGRIQIEDLDRPGDKMGMYGGTPTIPYTETSSPNNSITNPPMPVDRGDGLISFGTDQPVTPRQGVDLSNAPITYKDPEENFETSKLGMLDKAEKSMKGFGDYLMSEKGMLTAAMGFNNMTYNNPNSQGLNTYITNRLNTIQSMEGNINTAEALEKYKAKLTDPKDVAKMDIYIDQLKNNKINSSDALKGVFSSGGINVNVGDEKKGLYEAVNKSLVKKTDEYTTSGRQARELLDNYTRMSALLGQYGDTNLTEGNIQELRNLFGGIPLFNQIVDQAKLQTGREFQAVANNLVLSELRKNKGPQTDFDAIFAGTTLPNLGNSPKANEQLINYGKSVNTRNVLISELVRKADYTQPEKATKIMKLVETIEQQAPGVMIKPDGSTVHYNQWAEQQEGTGLDKLVRWTNVYRKTKLGLPEIDLSALGNLN